METIEKRHAETISKLREELKQAKDDLFKERTENTSRNNKDVSNLNAKVEFLVDRCFNTIRFQNLRESCKKNLVKLNF